MKVLITTILLICSFKIVNAQENSVEQFIVNDSTFYERIITDKGFQNSSYWILNIQSPTYIGKAAITNSGLQAYLFKFNDVKVKDYQEFMRNLIRTGDTLKVGEIQGTHFQKINPHPNVEFYAKLGKDKFLKHYFQQDKTEKMFGTLKTLNFSLLEPQEAYQLKLAIINQLFEWHIFTRDDCYGPMVYSLIGFSQE